MRSGELGGVAAGLMIGWRALAAPVPPWLDWTTVACVCWVALLASASDVARAWVTIAASAYLLALYGQGQLGPTFAAIVNLLAS